MPDAVILLTILLGGLFGWLSMIGAATYLAIAVLKIPLLAIALIGLVASILAVAFLLFVGELSPERQRHRYE